MNALNHDFLVITQYNIAAMHKIFLIEHDMDITNCPDRRYLSSPLRNNATRGDKVTKLVYSLSLKPVLYVDPMHSELTLT